jgi:hypothetical protein
MPFNPFTLREVCAYSGFSCLSVEIDFGVGQSIGRIRQSASDFSATTLHRSLPAREQRHRQKHRIMKTPKATRCLWCGHSGFDQPGHKD